jgi:hypothetical protein
VESCGFLCTTAADTFVSWPQRLPGRLFCSERPVRGSRARSCWVSRSHNGSPPNSFNRNSFPTGARSVGAHAHPMAVRARSARSNAVTVCPAGLATSRLWPSEEKASADGGAGLNLVQMDGAIGGRHQSRVLAWGYISRRHRKTRVQRPPMVDAPGVPRMGRTSRRAPSKTYPETGPESWLFQPAHPAAASNTKVHSRHKPPLITRISA